MRAYFYAHPWDLYDIGVEIALDRLVDLGITGVNLALCHPAISAVSPMNPFRTVYYGEDGAVYFHPDSGSYSWTAMKPKASRETDDPEYVNFLVEQAKARKLAVWPWVIYGHNHYQAREHPRAARVDPFGNPHVAQMAPSSRNFRLYCLGMTEDILDQVQPESFLIEGLNYYPWDYGLPNKTELVRLSPYQKFLLSLDFSDGTASMARKYRVNVDDLQGQIAAYLQDSLRRDPSDEDMQIEITEKFLEDKFEGELSNYLVAREAAASLLFENVARLIRSQKKSVTYAGSINKLETGLDLFRLRKSVDRYLLDITDDIREMEESIQAIRSQILPNSEIMARIVPAQFSTQDSFSTTLNALVNLGVDGFSFYNFGLLRPLHLQWINACKELWSRGAVSEMGA